MALEEVEFELPAEQFEMMGYPTLRQGNMLTAQFETAAVDPDPSSPSWYTVQPEALTPQFVRVGRANYAFAGQIVEADLMKVDEIETATLIVQCGDIPLRVLCAPDMDGRLPYGTWETRYLCGVSPIYGIVEDDFELPTVQSDMTIWSFRRLVLRPGDAQFGLWHETTELPPSPYEHDRVVVTARVHKRVL